MNNRLLVLALVAAATAGLSVCAPQVPPHGTPSPTAAVVHGRVYDRETGRPIPHATVMAHVAGDGDLRKTTADEQGRYELNDLPRGDCYLSASGIGYQMLRYGQLNPISNPKPIDLIPGRAVENADFRLSRSGVIAGRVVDEFGEAMPNVMVSARRYRFRNGSRVLTDAGAGPQFTDDLGRFRLYDLAPADYYVSASIRSRATDAANATRRGYTLTYAPATTDIGDARRVTIGVGTTIERMDVSMIPATVARVSGTVVMSNGELAATGDVVAMEIAGSSLPSARAPISHDGTFALPPLPPGKYVLHAGMPVTGPQTGAARMSITVAGRDITGVRLAFELPSIVSGRIVLNPSPNVPIDRRAISIRVEPMEPQTNSYGTLVDENLAFEVKVMPGVQSFLLTHAPDGWTLKAVRLNGVDITDGTFNVRLNENLSGLEVELSNRATIVTGKVLDDRGATPADYTVVVFARDERRWNGISRYIATARRGGDGRFTISGLPPGEYYAAAFENVNANALSDPDVLAQIRSSAASLTLSAGETSVVDLKVGAGS